MPAVFARDTNAGYQDSGERRDLPRLVVMKGS